MENFIFGPLEHDDIEKLGTIQPDDWSDITGIHRLYLESPFCYPTKTMIDDELAGIGTAICFQKTGWLAHIIVSKNHRKKGIGTAIVRHLVDYLQNGQGCESISLIATELGFPVYQKYGFSVQSEYCALASEKIVDGFSMSDGIIEVVEDDYSELLEIDQRISGENRRSLIRPFFSKGFAYRKKGKIVGFYVPELGEGPIIAIDAEAGIELLKLKMRTSKRIVFPSENAAAHRFLLAAGYEEKARIKRMILGKPFDRRPEGCYGRIGGFVG